MSQPSYRAQQSGRLRENNLLRFGKNQSVETIIVEERISDADFGKSCTDQVLPMAHVTLVVDPPIDDSLPIQRRIIAIDVFGNGFGKIPRIFHAGLRRGTIRSGMDIDLMTSHIIGLSLCGLGQQSTDSVSGQAFLSPVAIEGVDHLG